MPNRFYVALAVICEKVLRDDEGSVEPNPRGG